MIRTINAIEHDGLKERMLTMLFDVPDEEFDLISAVKAAAKEYCMTEDGLKTYIGNCSSFNWADFECYVPNEICMKYGFRKINGSLSDISVNWDEQLVDLESED